MDEYTVIGKVLKPQALKGEVRISPITRDVTQYLNYEYLYIGENLERRDIDYARIQDSFVVVKFCNINDADTADSLRNELLYVDKSQLGQLADDEYYITDLIGCDVVDADSKELFGKISLVDEYSSVNTITMVKDDKEYLFPFLERVVKDVDISNKKVFVDKEKLMEVLVDED